MNYSEAGRPQLLVIYPYKFHDFIYKLMELDYFDQYCDVMIWDISQLVSRNFSRAVQAARSGRDNVEVIQSFSDLARGLWRMSRRPDLNRLCIINETPNNSLASLACNLLLTVTFSGRNVAILDYFNGGIPLRFLSGANGAQISRAEISIFGKVALLWTEASSAKELLKSFSRVMFSRISRILPSPVTHRLVAGEDWMSLANSRANSRRKIKVLMGHSHDYSNSLRAISHDIPSQSPLKTVVFLDGAAPFFGSDAALFGRKVFFTVEAWYPALCKLFDRLESELNVEVIIAGHYKTAFPPRAPIFGNRRVIYGRTAELVRDSEFVITRASTATAFAVAFRKPIIFIYSTQLSHDLESMSYGRGMAEMLGKNLINVDEPPEDIRPHLAIDETRYAQYKRACLTSADASPRPNFQIIIEDVLSLQIKGASAAGLEL
jgi:hypothetical protein